MSGTLGFVSDYRFSGISQTSGDPAIQGHFDVAFENGIYASTWASNVDWGDDANLELDYFLGYASKFTQDLSYDVSVAYYTYPGYSQDINYGQVTTKLNYKHASMSYGYSNDYSNSGKSAEYVALNYDHPLPKHMTLNLHVGRSMGTYWKNMSYGEYDDYSIGLSGQYKGLDLSLAWITTDIQPHTHSGALRDDNTLVFGGSHTF